MTAASAVLIVLLFLFAWLGQRTGALTRGGALAGVAGGSLVFSAFGTGGLFLVLLFAGAGSLGSRLPGGGGHEARSAAHAVANLGVPGLLAIAAHAAPEAAPWRLAFGASIASSLSDTMATEWGTRYGGTPRSILTGRLLGIGRNGGVTWIGSFAGALASLAVAFAGQWGGLYGAAGTIRVAVAGFLGNGVDSVLGATIESRGIVGNHTVNFLAALAAAGLALLFA